MDEDRVVARSCTSERSGQQRDDSVPRQQDATNAISGIAAMPQTNGRSCSRWIELAGLPGIVWVGEAEE